MVPHNEGNARLSFSKEMYSELRMRNLKSAWFAGPG